MTQVQTEAKSSAHFMRRIHQPRVLIVATNPDHRRQLALRLEYTHTTIWQADNTAEATSLCKVYDFDHIFISEDLSRSEQHSLIGCIRMHDKQTNRRTNVVSLNDTHRDPGSNRSLNAEFDAATTPLISLTSLRSMLTHPSVIH